MFEAASVGDYEVKLIEDFIRSKVKRASASGVCLGLSGGIDSAVTAALSARALGPEKVHALILPETTTPDEDLRDAEMLASALGINHEVIDISQVIADLVSLVRIPSTTATANMKARTRMLLIYQAANVRDLMVIGTSNKSELMLGYFTKYGDGACDISPIGDLYKTQVWELARHLALPDNMINKEPTAGLMAGQTDKDELGFSYYVLDRILIGLESGYSPDEVAGVLDIDIDDVLSIQNRVRKSIHKRRGPQILKLQGRTVNLDMREQL